MACSWQRGLRHSRLFGGFAPGPRDRWASPAIDFKSEGLITGMAAKMFTVAGPVIVFGVAASAVYGVFLMVNQLGWW